MTTPLADSLGFAESYGAIVDQPKPGGPAANAGIEAGDVLTTINGVPTRKIEEFYWYHRDAGAGFNHLSEHMAQRTAYATHRGARLLRLSGSTFG